MKHLMSRMNQFGVQNADAAGSENGLGLGSMTDASKRLRETEDEAWTDSEYDGSSWALPTSMTPMAQQPPSDQMPMMNHPAETKVVLLPGVSSIDEWGRTMCELPAVAALKKSYLELAEDPTHHDYLMWVISVPNSGSCLLIGVDLINYRGKSTKWKVVLLKSGRLRGC